MAKRRRGRRAHSDEAKRLRPRPVAAASAGAWGQRLAPDHLRRGHRGLPGRRRASSAGPATASSRSPATATSPWPRRPAASPRTSCWSARTPARSLDDEAADAGAFFDGTEPERPALGHRPGGPGRARRTSRSSCCRSPVTCGCRSPAPGSEDRINTAYSDGRQTLIDTIQESLRHPDQPLHRGRLRRLPAPGRVDRRRAHVVRHRHAGPAHRPRRQRRGLRDPRRRAGPGPRPQPLPRVRRGRVAGAPTRPATSAASPASRR